MSLESLPGSQFWDRLLLLLTDPRKRTLLLEKAHAPYLGELPTVAAATTTAAAAAGMKCRPPSFRLLPIMKCRDGALPRHCLVHRLPGRLPAAGVWCDLGGRGRVSCGLVEDSWEEGQEQSSVWLSVVSLVLRFKPPICCWSTA